MTDKDRAWIAAFTDERGAAYNIAFRGVHPLYWWSVQLRRRRDLVLLWYAETSPHRLDAVPARDVFTTDDIKTTETT